MAESNQERPTVVQTKLELAGVLTNCKLPEVSEKLKSWARSQVNCKIVVTGVIGESVSALAASLAGKEVIDGSSGLYWQQIIPQRANLNIYDCGGFPRVGTKQPKAKEIVSFQYRKDTHLLIFCIPMTGDVDNFVHSEHAEALKRLVEEDEKILFNTIIALIDAHQIRDVMARCTNQSQRTLKQFFEEKLGAWKEKIRIYKDGHCYLYQRQKSLSA